MMPWVSEITGYVPEVFIDRTEDPKKDIKYWTLGIIPEVAGIF